MGATAPPGDSTASLQARHEPRWGPATAAAGRVNLDRTLRDPSLRATAIRLAERLRAGLRELGADVRGYGVIVPWVLGAETAALQAASLLRSRGVHAVAVRPPTVPEGTSRIRFAVTAAHTDEDVDRALAAVRETIACVGR